MGLAVVPGTEVPVQADVERSELDGVFAKRVDHGGRVQRLADRAVTEYQRGLGCLEDGVMGERAIGAVRAGRDRLPPMPQAAQSGAPPPPPRA
jgi:hypothetical protein